jgi:diguanylate cyclase (GGDEF)-like protein/PAS domain S-box-containing protein
MTKTTRPPESPSIPDNGEISERKAFLELGEKDALRLRMIHERMRQESGHFVDDIYEHLLKFPAMRDLLAEEDNLLRVKNAQNQYFSRLFSGDYDQDYIADRLAVGIAHQRIGLEPKWYIGAYRKYLSALFELLGWIHSRDSDGLVESANAVMKVVFLDVCLALDAYFHHEHDLLRESEELYRQTYENAPVGIAHLGLDGQYLRANRKALEIMGYGLEELSHLRYGDITHPDDKVAENARAHDLISGVTDFIAREKRYVRKDGTNVWVHVYTSLVHDGTGAPKHLVSVMSDISERKRIEETLNMAMMVFESSSDAVLVSDLNSRILMVNPAFSKITGYQPDDILCGKSSIPTVKLEDLIRQNEVWSEVKASGHFEGEVWNKRKNGEEYAQWLNISTVCDSDGVPCRHISVFSDISHKKNADTIIWKQANFDSLTELPNRHMFLDRLEMELRKADRTGFPVALLYLDLDRFKGVNDGHGHAMGDILLKEAGERIKSCVRAVDTVARMGGDEFTVILGEINEFNNVERIAQMLLQKLSEPFELMEQVVYVSASIGITLYPADASSSPELLKNADQAMYVAKNQGRGRYNYFTPAMQEVAQQRARLANELRNSISRNQLEIHYQPITDMATGTIRKAEALVRWRHPTLGMIPPNEFIPIAEETGMISEIGEWVFREVAKQVAQWRKSHHEEFQISINASPMQFRNGGICHKSWTNHLETLGLPGQSVVVEITESLLLDSTSDVLGQLTSLRNSGFQISLDDFGTGYSSLSYLNKFDIDYLKIDRSFVRDLEKGSNNIVLCEAIIVMANKLGIKVIAEGVETEEQRGYLSSAGCDLGQGYLFSKPIPANDFEVLLYNQPKEDKPGKQSRIARRSRGGYNH